MSMLLLVAPNPELSTMSELVSAMGGNQVETLRSPLSADTLLNAIQIGNWWGIHFAADTNDKGIAVSAGEVVDIATFQQAIAGNAHMPEFVFVNTCYSIALAAAAYEVGVSYAIGWTYKVDDHVAALFGSTFYVNLRFSRDIHKAFDASIDVLRARYPQEHLPILLDGRMPNLEQRIRDLSGQLRDDKLDRERYIILRRSMLYALVLLPVVLSAALAIVAILRL